MRARRVQDWPYSTFHRYVKEGIYPVDWGGDGLDDLKQEYGE
jgi:putative transposase